MNIIINLNFARRNIIFILLIALPIAPATALAKVINAPFRATIFTQEELIIPTPTCPSLVGGTTIGTGTSPLLGAVFLVASDCITPIQDYFAFAGKLRLAVSDGTELFADYSGLLIPASEPLTLLYTNSAFEITGGTGRFLQATGGGAVQGRVNISSGAGMLAVTGMLSENIIPESTSLSLLGIGLLGIIVIRRRQARINENI